MTQGIEVVNLKVTSTSNPLLRDSINVYTQVGTGIEEEYKTPEASSQSMVLRIFPNPFRDIVNITYSLGHSADGTVLVIYNSTGQLVRQYDHTAMRLSDHVSWDGTDNQGLDVGAGVYFIKLVSKNRQAIQKVILLR